MNELCPSCLGMHGKTIVKMTEEGINGNPYVAEYMYCEFTDEHFEDAALVRNNGRRYRESKYNNENKAV